MPTFTTNDGVGLNYIEQGDGAPLLMIPGWSQTAAQFDQQLDDLSKRRRVIAVDMRGHGESDKPEHGYKIQRLAMDVRNMVEGLGLDPVSLLGHSMGCSVIWCYLDLFGEAGIDKLVLVDQMPSVTAQNAWTETQKIEAGAIFDGKTLLTTIDELAGPRGIDTTKSFVGGMFTDAYPADRAAWVIEQNLKLPRAHAASLLYNHAGQDWRDVIQRISLPTLIVGGKKSLIHWRSQEWMQRQIPGSQLEIFEEADGGSHFMFMENASRFNALVDDFLG